MENVELSDFCCGLIATVDYEQIKDNYYYCILGDFKLVIDKSTDNFNATKLCQLGLKNFFEWRRLEKSKQLVEYYENCSGYSQNIFIYEVKLQNKNNKQIIGTYVPKELILDIAFWVSTEFYNRCNNIVTNYFVKFKKMDNDNLKQLKEIENKVEKLTLENCQKEDIIKEKINQINELKQIISRLEETREKDRNVLMRQEQYIYLLGISLEEVKDQNEEILDLNKGLTKDVGDVKRKLGITSDKVGLRGSSLITVGPNKTVTKSNKDGFVIRRLLSIFYP